MSVGKGSLLAVLCVHTLAEDRDKWLAKQRRWLAKEAQEAHDVDDAPSTTEGIAPF